MTRPERTWETSRLLAKPAVVVDAQVIFDEYASDASVAKYMTWTRHRSVEETVEFLSRCERVWIEGSAFLWSLWRKQDGAVAGLIEIRVRTSAVDLGYALARRWWRQGLMSEAVAAIVEWALASRRSTACGQPAISKMLPRPDSSNGSEWSERGSSGDG